MKNINNSKLPQFSKKLPGTFWGITCVFNPQGHKNKIENYNIFRKASKKQGLKLITVECAFGNKPFFLTKDDADILIQVRSNSILWQKERLLNIAYENLPKDCDKIAWIDADIIFINDNWIKETSDLLEKYVVVKPHKYVLRISKKDSAKMSEKITRNEEINLNEINENDSEYRITYLSEKNLFLDDIENKSYLIKRNLFLDDIKNKKSYGFAWAARKEIFSDIGFYDKMIIGGGDSIMMSAFANGHDMPLVNKGVLSIQLKNDILVWSKKILNKVNNSIGFTRGKIIHLYHGPLINRNYFYRYLILKKYDFDPNTDIKLNEYKCFEWATPKEKLHKSIKLYFNYRNENDSFSEDFIYYFHYIKNSILNHDDFFGLFGIKFRNYFPTINKNIKKIKRFLKNLSLDRFIGMVGILIKKISSRLYYLLKIEYIGYTNNKNKIIPIALKLYKIERHRILANANNILNESPFTITSHISERNPGSKHDYFSEADYWWPDISNLDGPYIRKDGITNPNNFNQHRRDIINFKNKVSTLTAAFLITKDIKYSNSAIKHLYSWFIDDNTKMNPNLEFAQTIKGKNNNRGFGIIDSIHLIEVAISIMILEKNQLIKSEDLFIMKKWFSDYLFWLMESKKGIAESKNINNHETFWLVQVSVYSKLLNDNEKILFCKKIFKEILLPNQMASDGSFPFELGRTKPYNYSLFNLDGMIILCQVLSDYDDNLFNYTLLDGRNIKNAIDFIYPFVLDKNKWKYGEDIMYYKEFPNRQPFLLFGGLAYGEKKYLELWSILNPDPINEEAIRNFPINQPILWINNV